MDKVSPFELDIFFFLILIAGMRSSKTSIINCMTLRVKSGEQVYGGMLTHLNVEEQNDF
jgi:hypothetical protein